MFGDRCIAGRKLGCEPTRQLTNGFSRQKIQGSPGNRALVRLRTYAHQVLGRTRFHANSTIREHALWGQHLLRGSASRRTHLHFRLRHRFPRAWPATAKRIRRPSLFCPRVRLPLSLGSYSGHAIFSAFVYECGKPLSVPVFEPYPQPQTSPGRSDGGAVLSLSTLAR